MTEPSRIYSISELLARPELILSSRTGFGEATVDLGDPSSFDRLSDPEDIPDNFDFEVPRDPDLYNPPRRAKQRPKNPNGAPAPSTVEHRETTSPKGSGERRAGGTGENAVFDEEEA